MSSEVICASKTQKTATTEQLHLRFLK